MPSLQPPPVKSSLTDPNSAPSEAPDWFKKWLTSALFNWPWLKWFQNFVTYLNNPILYTPVITAASGAFTTVSATGRYRQIGKLIFIQISILITTNGTAGTFVIATLPFPALTGILYVLNGRADTVSGKALQGDVTRTPGSVSIFNYDNTYPGASGETLVLSGFYEIA